MDKRYVRYFLIILPAAIMLFSCDSSTKSDIGGPDSVGKGGSTARFAICGNYLYTVNNSDIRVFNIADPKNPAPLTKVYVGFGIETIFPRGDSLLFIGSQNGMYIYEINSSGYLNPNYLSYYDHITSCDPVVADSKYAYITLNSEHTWCGRYSNELQIVNISNIANPQLVKSYDMTSPKGLGIDNNLLFVCDAGLKVYDITDGVNIILKHWFKNISANDVIPDNGNLLVIGNDGFYQYKYQNDTITFLSKILKD